MIEGTQYTALVTSLASRDWDGVVALIDNCVQAALRASQARLMRDMTAPRVIQTPTRALDTDFVISADRDAIAIYTIELSVTGSLLIGVSHAEVGMTLNGVSFGQHVLDLASTLTLGLSIVPTVRKPMVTFAPAGTILNMKTSASGGGTVSVITAQEILL